MWFNNRTESSMQSLKCHLLKHILRRLCFDTGRRVSEWMREWVSLVLWLCVAVKVAGANRNRVEMLNQVLELAASCYYRRWVSMNRNCLQRKKTVRLTDGTLCIIFLWIHWNLRCWARGQEWGVAFARDSPGYQLTEQDLGKLWKLSVLSSVFHNPLLF